MPTVTFKEEKNLICSECSGSDFDCIGHGGYRQKHSGIYQTLINYQCKNCKHVTSV